MKRQKINLLSAKNRPARLFERENLAVVYLPEQKTNQRFNYYDKFCGRKSIRNIQINGIKCVMCVCELWNTRNLLKLNAQCDNFSHSSLTLLWKIANYYMCDVCVGLCTCIKPTLTMHYIYMNPYTFMQSICKQKSKLYTQ